MDVQIPLWKGKGQHAHIVEYTVVSQDAITEYPEILDIQWRKSSKGYATVQSRENGHRYVTSLARTILGLERGDPRQADHINRNRLDNRTSNLRIVSHDENVQNCSARGNSRYRGVHHCRNGRWRAQVSTPSGRASAYFDSELNAARWARAQRMEHLPFSTELDDLA